MFVGGMFTVCIGLGSVGVFWVLCIWDCCLYVMLARSVHLPCCSPGSWSAITPASVFDLQSDVFKHCEMSYQKRTDSGVVIIADRGAIISVKSDLFE